MISMSRDDSVEHFLLAGAELVISGLTAVNSGKPR